MSRLAVFRNGTSINTACASTPVAIPTPCVADRFLSPDGDIGIVVNTVAACGWTFGVGPPRSFDPATARPAVAHAGPKKNVASNATGVAATDDLAITIKTPSDAPVPTSCSAADLAKYNDNRRRSK